MLKTAWWPKCSYVKPTHARTITTDDCLTKCSYAKSCNLIGWIIGHGPSIHFRTDGRDRLSGLWFQLKHRLLGKMEK